MLIRIEMLFCPNILPLLVADTGFDFVADFDADFEIVFGGGNGDFPRFWFDYHSSVAKLDFDPDELGVIWKWRVEVV